MSEGTVLTFYSYKGGVGRTFTLANIGALLSSWGYKVLCIDWDLEAPGLQYYFQPWIQDKDRPGLVDLIQSHVNEEQPDWRNYITDVHFSQTNSHLSFMSAGQQNDTYVQRMQALDWAALYVDPKHNLGYFLEKLRAEWKQAFDFILIDSRTGITDIGNICTVQLPDLLVLLLTANDQSLTGSLDTVSRQRIAREDLPFDRGNALIVPIISRFERRIEYTLSEQWLNIFAQRLAPFYNEWIHKDITVRDILNFTRIPSVPFWSFGERLPVIEKGTDDPDDIGFPLETLTALVAQGFAFTDDLVRNREAFVNSARRQGSGRVSPTEENAKTNAINIFISYSRSDTALEQQLESHLKPLQKSGKVQIWSDRLLKIGTNWDQEISSRLENADIILLLLSSDYFGSATSYNTSKELEQALRQAQTGKAQVIPILLRPVDWQASPLSSLRPLPSNGRPVTERINQDDALTEFENFIS